MLMIRLRFERTDSEMAQETIQTGPREGRMTPDQLQPITQYLARARSLAQETDGLQVDVAYNLGAALVHAVLLAASIIADAIRQEGGSQS